MKKYSQFQLQHEATVGSLLRMDLLTENERNNRMKNPFRKKDRLNVMVSMPCPLKVPFKQLMTHWSDAYNTSHVALPVYCPDILDCTPGGIDVLLKSAPDEHSLPDVLLSSSLALPLSEEFYGRFIRTGIMEGYTDLQQLERIPETIRQQLAQYGLGILAFSSWSIVQDLSVTTDLPTPSTWAEIAKPQYQNHLTIHGCHGKTGSTTLLLFLQQQAGKEAVAQFARNVTDMRHFAQIIKRMGSTDPLRTAFNLLPDVAASHIPSHKPVRILSLQEGKPLHPMLLMVKASKKSESYPVLNFFHSEQFAEMLAGSGYFMPEAIDWTQKLVLPDPNIMIKKGFERVAEELEVIYRENLRHDVIDARQE